MANIARVEIDMKRVQDLALDRLWTMSELARRSHISITTLLALKAGRRRASALTIRKLSVALGVPEQDIIKQ